MERRGRTALLISTAACLGVLGGVCTGYLVQAERSPTPLPPLSQGTVPQAKGDAPEPLSAARDRRVKVDGDLRKLLVTRPKGAKDWEGPWNGDARWLSLSAYADSFTDPSVGFGSSAERGFRRAVTAGWVEHETRSVEVSLVQFNQDDDLVGASLESANNQYGARDKRDTRSWPIPGTGELNGGVYVHDTPEHKAGYRPLYSAEAFVWRGDISVEIYMYDTKPIPKAAIMGLAQRQMGKL
ncbi:hypothetical protein [Streptomyces acidiscabies]|uniref:hypothetical protein n=1 Tax=Streptomyces acidiscabies TaxID=42234 RepID=UPI0038F79C7B